MTLNPFMLKMKINKHKISFTFPPPRLWQVLLSHMAPHMNCCQQAALTLKFWMAR